MDHVGGTNTSLYVLSLLVPVYPLMGFVIEGQQVSGGSGQGEA